MTYINGLLVAAHRGVCLIEPEEDSWAAQYVFVRDTGTLRKMARAIMIIKSGRRLKTGC